MIVEINGKSFRVEFSYRRSAERIGKPKTTGGVSACAIVGDGWPTSAPRFIALGAVVCGSADRWVRREARQQAFLRCVNDCGLLKDERLAFFAWFDGRFAQPVQPRREPRFKPSAEEIQRRRETHAGIGRGEGRSGADDQKAGTP